MDKEEYRKIVECLQGKINDKKLQKQTETFEVKDEKVLKTSHNVKHVKKYYDTKDNC